MANLCRYFLTQQDLYIILHAIMKNKMKITLLGTGTSQGVPVIACSCRVCSSENFKDKRLRSSIMIEVNDQRFVIDTGPDFRQQMLRENVEDIDAILFTHHHKDHVAGMDDIRAFNHKWKKDMQLYCTERTKKALHMEFPYVFTQEKYPGTPSVDIHVIDSNSFSINGVDITPIDVLHYKMQVFGFRISNFIYLTDVSKVPDSELEKMKGADLIILDALRRKKHLSHLNLDEAIELISKLRPKRALLTHISHYMGLHEEVNNELPDYIDLAFDQQKILLEY
tara:strand:+ start:1600 stop:2442 length:843 start_codon:yes stop_codon:yes gene_type:complete